MELSSGARLKSFLQSRRDTKLGPLRGVFIPNILQMVGVIFFLRLGWILGHVGIPSMLLIISLASMILLFTGLSLTSLVTNMKVEGGGAYFIISRVLGIEFGSAIGALLCLSQAASIALCVSGFALSIQPFFPYFSLAVLESLTLLGLLGLSFFSAKLAFRVQGLVFFAILVSIGAIFLGNGSHLDPALFEKEIPLSSLSFWGAFAMFFPAITGIEVGMSLSGDLRHPSRSLAIGTLASILVAYLLYSCLSLFLSIEISKEMLRAHPFILYHMIRIKPLILMGVWGATLSSALGSLLGAPRVIQALAKDHVLPSFLSRGSGKENHPRQATFIVASLSLLLVLFTDINHIIPMITMICLVSYGLINFMAFSEAFIQNPSWRPTIVTPWSLSLLGAVSCFVAMFLIHLPIALMVLALTALLCILTAKRHVGGGWDDIRYSLISFLVHRGAAWLSKYTPNAKSWRPHLIAFFDPAALSHSLAYFAYALDQGKGFLTFGTTGKSAEESSFREELFALKIPAFLHVNHSEDSPANLVQHIKNYGFGPLVPNSIILPVTSNIHPILEVVKERATIEKNLIFLKSDDQSTLYSQEFTRAKRIHLWWRGGNQNNFELCLALSYTLRGSPIWSGAQIHIKSLAQEQRELDQLSHVFERYEKKLRIKNLYFSPILAQEGDFFPILEMHSQEADFTFLGLPTVGEGAFESYFVTFIEKTTSISNVAFVLAGEHLFFQKIFS